MRYRDVVAAIDATVERLRADGARFRNDIFDGVGGRQILVEDPPETRSSSSSRRDARPR